jgi:glucan-binding YG repeat protein
MLLKKSFLQNMMAIFIAIIVIFAAGFMAPPVKVYAATTPTLDEVKYEIGELSRRLAYAASWQEQDIVSQDTKTFDLVRAYSEANSGDKIAYILYVNKYAQVLGNAKENLAYYEQQNNATQVFFYKKIVAIITKLQTVAQTAVVHDMHFTVSFDTVQKKALVRSKSDEILKVPFVALKAWNDTASTEMTNSFPALAEAGYYSPLIKSGYHTVVTMTFIEPDLGQLTYTAINPGWDQQTNGKWKWYDAANDECQGWLTVGGARYRFGGSDNGWVMLTGWWVWDDWFYFGNDGKMAMTGWKKVSNNWYYFKSSGAMRYGWMKDGNNWYYLNSRNSGVMSTGWKQIAGTWYHFGSSGAMQTGWQKIAGKWYYFGPAGDGKMKTGKHKIGGKTHTFNSNGVWTG